MKKTLALLLAAASAAFAADKVDLAWNNNTASLTGAGLTKANGATVAYTLDMNKVKSLGFYETACNFYFSDELNNGLGLGNEEYNGGKYLGAWVADSYGGYLCFQMFEEDITDLIMTDSATYASVVYSIQGEVNYSIQMDVYIWDAAGELVASNSTSYERSAHQFTLHSFNSITVDSNYASGTEVYNGVVEDRQAAAYAVLGLNGGDDSAGDGGNDAGGGSADTTVPEPTTATLSLLALAALAARRRRK